MTVRVGNTMYTMTVIARIRQMTHTQTDRGGVPVMVSVV